MTLGQRLRHIGWELWVHSPFTLLGAAAGIVFMVLFRNISQDAARGLFAVFHPLHVFLSAMVTAALFRLHRKAASFLIILVIGFVGSIGISTLSDSVLPFLGQSVLGAAIPTHAAVHDCPIHGHGADCDHDHDSAHAHAHSHEPHLHLGFIEEWFLVLPAAILGVVAAYFRPRTKIPHAGHLFVSTWASASFMLMNSPEALTPLLLLGMFVALFVAVWIPCCLSDIVFPTLFLRADGAHLGRHGCLLCKAHDPQEGADKEKTDDIES